MREPSIMTLFTEETADIRFEDLLSSFTEEIIYKFYCNLFIHEAPPGEFLHLRTHFGGVGF